MSGAGPVLGWAGLGWAGLGWAGLGAFMNMNYSQSVPLTATNFLRQQEQSSWHGIVPASSHVSLHPHTSHQHVSRVAIITTLTARVHVLNCTYLRLKARVAFIITRVTVIISHQSSHWLYISRATHVYTVDICGRRNWKPIIWLEHREMWQNIKLGHFIASLSPSLRCNGILSFPHHTHCI